MKLPKPFTIYDLRFAIWKKSAGSVMAGQRACAAGNSQFAIRNSQLERGGSGFQLSTFNPQLSERGMALVITLILLSVTLVMAIAFLAISRRERSSITTSTDTATARLAADAALANAEGVIVANILSTANPYNYGLLVSRNSPPLNYTNGLSDLASLRFSPRAPVFVPINSLSNDFRFYLDLNRNGQFDPSGSIVNVDNLGNVLTNIDGSPLVTPEGGDPEWIGVLERPDANYAPNNQFLSRYLFYCLPVGNTLDLNYIHNQALVPRFSYPVNPMIVGDEGYLRNQGVGSWEINLAAFLADLNTNIWGQVVGSGVGAPIGSALFYQYNPPPLLGGNSGAAFQDAFALLTNRYAGNYNTLANAQNLFGANAAAVFQNNIDGYDVGPLMTTPAGINASGPITSPWVGADNTNHFFDLSSDLFNPNKNSVQFANRLLNAGTNTDSYDRYTFYRLLDQIGTDSAPETGKMNLNYDNLDSNGNVVSGAETNFYAWDATKFFTNAADRMLKLYTANWLAADSNNFVATFNMTVPFGIANIPVLVSNRFVYSPAVQRVLQLAANIYDASTNTFYPSRFRPLFTKNAAGDVFITGYERQTNSIIRSAEFTDSEIATPVEVTDLPVGQDMLTNVYGVPWILGAKKGFPNFNEFSMNTAMQVTRKLQVTRDTNSWAFTTNQMYIFGITNKFGVECWNSYNASYPRTGTGLMDIIARDNLSLQLTNENGLTYFRNIVVTNPPFFLSTNIWPAHQPGFTNAFLIPVNVTAVLFTNDIFVFNEPSPPNNHYFTPGDLSSTNYLDKGVIPLPHFGLLTTNRLQVVIVDYSAGVNAGQIVDYVQLNGLDDSLDLNAKLADPDDIGLWSTNTQDGSLNGVPMGVIQQMATSKQGGSVPGVDVKDGVNWAVIPNLPNTPAAAQFYFSLFLSHKSTGTYTDPNTLKRYPVTITTTNTQAPFTPTRSVTRLSSWQVNDPLVHYLASDLARNDNEQYNNLGVLNERYMPWGGHLPINPNNPDDFNTRVAFQRALKDPLVYNSDDWDFPTNKFPTVGWLGRVHRGTPWQTVYLKAFGVEVNDWSTWTGDLNMYDATNMVPDRDRLLFDLFTTAPNDNATRGQLSVNQTHFPAWSALFSGMIVPTNLVGGYTIIDPAGTTGTSAAVFQLFTNIANMRSAYTIPTSTGGAFKHIGDVLSAVTLTEQSPFLNLADTNNLNDELYEWLPQQMMSLLRVSTVPRYVIYSYGQTLAPAPNSVVTSGGAFSGMVTNYQVVAETITRAVVRIEGAPTNAHAVIESFNILPPP